MKKKYEQPALETQTIATEELLDGSINNATGEKAEVENKSEDENWKTGWE